ncbi:hypothetical protein J31TS3_57650 [Paenibacillus lactis]|nr:hypothetical protein J31TS3_57650 [Paenibacillus lactis]
MLSRSQSENRAEFESITCEMTRYGFFSPKNDNLHFIFIMDFATNAGLMMYKDLGMDEYYGQTINSYTPGDILFP